jgi:predicted ester cyclase
MSSPTEEANKTLVRTLIEESLNKGNLGLADAHFTPDYEVHIPGRTDLPRGPGAFKRVIGMWRSAFPDFHMTIETLIAEGDQVANRFTTRGTHTGPLMGLAPTGRPIVVYGMEFHRLADGKVAESWICDDIPSILQQLGVLPRPSLGPPSGGPPPAADPSRG